MRVLYINTLYSPDLYGGAERVLQAQVEAMHAAGHQVAVLALGSGRGLRVDHVNGVPVWRAGLRNLYSPTDELYNRQHGRVSHALWHLLDSYNPRMAAVVREVVQTFRPEVAACHNLPGWSIAAWDALSALRVPIVQVLHDQYFLCANTMMFRDSKPCGTRCTQCRLLRLPHRHKSAQVDTVVGVSRFVLEKLLSYGYFRGARKTCSIHNVQAAGASPSCPAQTGDEVVFGFFGRLAPSKGIELLLETFTLHCENNWKLLVGGSGERAYQASLQSRFTHPQVEFLGHVAPGDFFPAIDISLVPSTWEDTLPSVVYESLLFGRPVVGSRIGGIPEMLSEANGALFTPGNGADLRRALHAMAARVEEFRGRVTAIQKDASPYRDTGRWLQQWVDVYTDAIEASRVRRG